MKQGTSTVAGNLIGPAYCNAPPDASCVMVDSLRGTISCDGIGPLIAKLLLPTKSIIVELGLLNNHLENKPSEKRIKEILSGLVQSSVYDLKLYYINMS